MILCSGENLIDNVPIKGSKDSFKSCIGGSPLNTALSLGKLKIPVYFFSRISNDFFGKKIISFLNKNNVNTSLTQRSNDLTTIGFVNIDKDNTDFTFYANNTSDRNLKNYFFSNTLKKKIKLAHFSSISLILKPGSEVYFQMMKDLRKHSLISIDPNIRKQLIKNKKSFKQRFNNFIKIADIIKLSNEDFSYLYDIKKADKIISQWLSKNKILFVILTFGKKGSKIYTKDFNLKINSFKIKVIDTVGAGDSYIAGVIAWLYNKGLIERIKIKKISKEHWLECLQFASKIAAINCMRDGCNPPNLSELKKINLTQK